MGVTFTPVFNRKNTKTKSGKYSIHIRITIDRNSYYLNPKLPKVIKDHWSGKPNKWIKEISATAFEINSLLQRKITELDKYVLSHRLSGKTVTISQIKDHFERKADVNILNDYAEEYIKNVKGLKLNTIKVYNTFLKHLNAFNNKIYFKDLNDNLLDSFRNYLQYDLGLKGAATKKYFDKLKVICKDATKNGYLELNENPFTFYSPKIKVEKPSREFLEEFEINKLLKQKFAKNTNLEFHRDMFLFQIYTGLYYSDLKQLKWENIKSGTAGIYISAKRTKNGNAFIIPLYMFNNGINILNKYGTKDNKFVFNGLISDQKFNEALKTIGSLASLDKSISNKVARHSFVQLWMSKGVERQFVSKMLGHTKESTTQEYYDLSIHNIFNKLGNIDFSNL